MRLRAAEYFPGAWQSQFIALVRKYETPVFSVSFCAPFPRLHAMVVECICHECGFIIVAWLCSRGYTEKNLCTVFGAMKKTLLIVCLCLMGLLAGCFNGSDRNSGLLSENTGENVSKLPSSLTAEVSIRLKLPDEALRAAFRAQTSASAVFSLKLINRGNLSSPIALMRKTAAISGGATAPDGTATVTFSSVPAVPVIATLELEGAGIVVGATKYQVFHGGADLLPGQNNVITIVASGSLQQEDVVAKAALLSIADFSTMNVISSAIFANLNEVYAAAAAGDKTLAEKIFTSYKNKVVGAKLIALTGGSVHSVGLRDDGTLVGFGNNAAGQLAIPGLAETLYLKFAPFTRRVRAIAARDDYSMLLCEDNRVYACGVNDMLQLGSSVGESTAYPAMVPGLNNITAISAGKQHALAIDNTGQLYAWGANNKGQLGVGSVSLTGVAPQAVAGMTGVTAIAAGNDFSLIVKDGKVFAAGDNSRYQLTESTVDGSTGDPVDSSSIFVQINLPGNVAVSAVAAGSGHCLALGVDGSVYSWGFNFMGQAGLGTTTVVITAPAKIAAPTSVKMVRAGANHSLIVTNAGELYIFGDNLFGQLGNSTTTNLTSPVRNSFFSAVSSAGCGENNSYVISTAGNYAFGDNTAGQVGNGSKSEYPVATPVSLNIASPWN